MLVPSRASVKLSPSVIKGVSAVGAHNYLHLDLLTILITPLVPLSTHSNYMLAPIARVRASGVLSGIGGKVGLKFNFCSIPDFGTAHTLSQTAVGVRLTV